MNTNVDLYRIWALVVIRYLLKTPGAIQSADQIADGAFSDMQIDVACSLLALMAVDGLLGWQMLPNMRMGFYLCSSATQVVKSWGIGK